MSVHHETKTIPLNRLVLWDGNVRKTGADTAIDELAASIEAHGLLNPLTVGGHFRKKHYVIAGGRRLRALTLLAEAGKLAKDEAIPCVQAAAADYTELSLAENVVRVAMHPADQFEAWKALVDDGHEAGGIAERFGVAVATVRKRLALGRVSPLIFEAYRQGEIDLEALQAFTVTDDHARQEALWEMLQGQRADARLIRQGLTEGEIPTSDRRIRFIGIEAYEAAGGAMRRNLFAAEGQGYCSDVALIDRLVREKLDSVAHDLQAEGWAWTEARLSFPWDERMAFEQAEADEDEDGEAVWSDEAKALAGAIVYLGYDGPAIERGLIRPGDLPEPETEGGNSAEPAQPVEPETTLPASLIEDLTAHRTAALRIELARRPDVGLAAAAHAVALSAFYHTGERGLKTSLSVRSVERLMKGGDEAPAVIALRQETEQLQDHLPGNPVDLWDWCLSASQELLLDLLAVGLAHSVDAVVTKADANRSGVAFGDALAKAVGLDMAAWYTPTADGYFSRLSKALILSDLEDAKGVPCAPAWAKLKKTELAALAERETAPHGWLPQPLR